MKVVLLAGALPFSDEGLYALNLRRGLLADGHEVVVLARHGALAPLVGGDDDTLLLHDLTGTPWRDLFELLRLAAYLETLRVDVVHVTTQDLDACGLFLARRLEVPRVTTIHRAQPTGLSRARPEAVIVPGQGPRSAAVNAARLDRTRVHVIPYGVDVPPMAQRAMPPAAPTVGTVGPLRRDCGIKVALLAAARLAQDFPTALFPVIGSGPYHRFLCRKARELALEASIVVCEPTVEPTTLFRALSVVVVPGRAEDLGGIALQAHAAGIPVVASAAGLAFDVVRDGVTGFLVPSGDVDALVARVTTLLRDPTRVREMADAAIARAGKFPLGAMSAATGEVYRSVCAERPALV